MLETLAPTDNLAATLAQVLPDGIDEATVRVVDEEAEWLTVRQGVVEPPSSTFDRGAMVTVWAGGGLGYAATADLRPEGLQAALETAKAWALRTAHASVATSAPGLTADGTYASPVRQPWSSLTIAERIELLRLADAGLGTDERIVARRVSLGQRQVRSVLISSAGGRIEQDFTFTYPTMAATAAAGGDAQTRTYGRGSFCGQGGIEVLDRFDFRSAAPQIAEEAIALLSAPNCPTDTMDLLVAPDQMILQIHESIGHPLELDRILGDERNYAGTSFVTPDMFGEFQYGSELLNVTFDPTVEGQLASYAFDDEGTPAARHHLIENGVLQRPLGGSTSQTRAGMAGVANTRACSWNRPPIDRMANLNVEPGDSSLEELIGGIEYGIFVHTNNSWSIDDSRNKFQFSCELGRMVRNGELGEVVRNPSYRGISQNFWRSLSGVGDQATFAVMGTPNCGKGELNQMIGTGHASPVCRFSQIEVFGADA